MTNDSRKLKPPTLEAARIQSWIAHPSMKRRAWEELGSTDEKRLANYRREYANGYKAATSGHDSAKWNNGGGTWAWDDGYLDGATGRERWHFAHCGNPDECGEH